MHPAPPVTSTRVSSRVCPLPRHHSRGRAEHGTGKTRRHTRLGASEQQLLLLCWLLLCHHHSHPIWWQHSRVRSQASAPPQGFAPPHPASAPGPPFPSPHTTGEETGPGEQVHANCSPYRPEHAALRRARGLSARYTRINSSRTRQRYGFFLYITVPFRTVFLILTQTFIFLEGN